MDKRRETNIVNNEERMTELHGAMGIGGFILKIREAIEHIGRLDSLILIRGWGDKKTRYKVVDVDENGIRLQDMDESKNFVFLSGRGELAERWFVPASTQDILDQAYEKAQLARVESKRKGNLTDEEAERQRLREDYDTIHKHMAGANTAKKETVKPAEGEDAVAFLKDVFDWLERGCRSGQKRERWGWKMVEDVWGKKFVDMDYGSGGILPEFLHGEEKFDSLIKNAQSGVSITELSELLKGKHIKSVKVFIKPYGYRWFLLIVD